MTHVADTRVHQSQTTLSKSPKRHPLELTDVVCAEASSTIATSVLKTEDVVVEEQE